MSSSPYAFMTLQEDNVLLTKQGLRQGISPSRPNPRKNAKRMLIADIRKKYNLPVTKNGIELSKYSLEILRSLLVFGEHEYIIDKIRAK